MPIYKISTKEPNKTFQHSHWSKDNVSIVVIRTFENINCSTESVDIPSFDQKFGPFGNSVNVVEHNCQVNNLLNQKIEYISYSDLFDKDQRTAINYIWNENKEQGLIENGWTNTKTEIWLSGDLNFEQV